MAAAAKKIGMKNKYANYTSMPKHPNFYQNEASKKIRYIKSFNGKSVVISCKTTSITEAKQIVEAELIRRFSANPAEDLRKKKGVINPPLSVYWQDLMDEKRASSEESTMLTYNTSWKFGIEPFWGDKQVGDVNSMIVTKFENWYLKTNPERNFFNTKKHLNMLFNYLKKQDLIRKTPELQDLDEIIIKKTKKKKVGRVFTPEEVSSLLNCAVDERTKVGILIYRYMGARKNEILKLEAVKVDLNKKVAHIWSYKNKKWREVPIPEVVYKDLKSWMAKNTHSKFLFPSITNPEKCFASQLFDASWSKTKELAGIKNSKELNSARIHDLRHTFATQTANDNWPPMVACQVLDMSLKEYQRTYVHISESDVRLMMNRSFEVSK